MDSRTEPDRLLRQELDAVSETCIRCNLCEKECAFLQKYGNPKDIADQYDPALKENRDMPFECSLCRLCTAVCPAGVDPAELFLRMRQEAVRRGGGDFPEHKGQRDYERRGTSRAYSYYGLPKGCDTVFFPGCALSGSRSEKVILSYEKLQRKIPSLGIVLDCCTKPSHDLGREKYFAAMFGEMRDYLTENGVRHVLVACPNCYRVFARYGTGLSTKMIYDLLASEPDDTKGETPDEKVTVHDPCVVRFEDGMHDAVRAIIRSRGYTVEEMVHAGRKTLCCGEGGSVGALVPALAANWGRLRQKEAAGMKIITYCAGCAASLSRLAPTVHVLDAFLESKPGGSKVAKPPLTYWKRLRLKSWFKSHVPAAISRERTFTTGGGRKKGGMIKFVLFLIFLAAVIWAGRTLGLSRYLEQDTLRGLIAGYGPLAPIAYMLFYTIAPALFLPGLPITIAGGILFGPFWGVVYAITGATAGACLAFLVSRYLAREWIETKLKNPRWKRLDEGVEKHGWKVVAFTRLIPLFPFNLLNYAFGLTGIGFRQYAVATFLCMLPACIAYIIFSSSLLDLIRGRVSPAFIVGLLLVILISVIPLVYKRYKTKRGEDGPL